MKTVLYILLTAVLSNFCFGQNSLQNELKVLQGGESMSIINAFVFGGLEAEDTKVVGLKRKAQNLLLESQLENYELGIFHGASYSFLFSTKPLNEDSCRYFLAIQKKVSEQLDEPDLWARYYKNESFLCDKINDHRCSLENQQKASQYYLKLNQSENVVKTYMNIAAIYSKLSDTLNNKKYKQLAFESLNDNVTQSTKSRLLINIGMGLITQYPDSSIYIAKQLMNESKDSTTIGICTYMVSESYLAKQMYASCIQNTDEFLHKYQDKVYPSLILNAFFNRSEAYFKSGYIQQALEDGNKALAIAQNQKASYIYPNLHKHLAKVNEQFGNISESNHHLREYIAVNDSIFSLEKAREIAELEEKYESVQKELAISELAQENSKKSSLIRNIVFISIGFSLVLTSLSFFYRNKTLQKEKEALKLEQQLFRSQMNPHFTFNVLGSLQSYIMEEGSSTEAAYYLSKFSKLLRKVLTQSVTEEIPLSEEMETLENYISLQKLRYGHFETKVSVDKDLDLTELYIPPMLVQPLVENSIEHGKVYQKENGFVHIIFSENMGMLTCKVVDNGKGIKSSKSHSHTSMALDIIKKRIGSTSNIQLEGNEHGGVTVSFTIFKDET